MKILLLIILLCTTCQAAVTLDATSTATCVNPGTTISWSHTVTTGGSSRIVIAAFHFLTNSPAQTILNANYGGEAMSLLQRVNDVNAASVEIWYKVNPLTGPNNVQGNLSASTNVCGGAWSFTNVHQSTPFGTPGTDNGFSTPSTINITSAANEIVIDAATFTGNDATPGGSQTQSWDSALAASTPNGHAEASRQTGAASTSMTWTFTGGNYVMHIAVAVKEVAAGGVTGLSNILAGRRRR